MALSKYAVEKAWTILNEINPKASNSSILEHDDEDPLKENKIIGVDHKQDDGWENVFMNVKDITPEQLRQFENRKREVPNSSFKKDLGEGITRIGWF